MDETRDFSICIFFFFTQPETRTHDQNPQSIERETNFPENKYIIFHSLLLLVTWELMSFAKTADILCVLALAKLTLHLYTSRVPCVYTV